jgi:hypothetical protein
VNYEKQVPIRENKHFIAMHKCQLQNVV